MKELVFLGIVGWILKILVALIMFGLFVAGCALVEFFFEVRGQRKNGSAEAER